MSLIKHKSVLNKSRDHLNDGDGIIFGQKPTSPQMRKSMPIS